MRQRGEILFAGSFQESGEASVKGRGDVGLETVNPASLQGYALDSPPDPFQLYESTVLHFHCNS